MERKLSVISLNELNVMKMKTKVSQKIAFKRKRKMVTDANDISYWNAVYYPIILLISILTTSMLTLFPRQNAIIYQSYWYEMFIIYVVFFGVTVMLNQVVEAVVYLNVK